MLATAYDTLHNAEQLTPAETLLAVLVERVTRIELALSAWEAAETPLWITL